MPLRSRVLLAAAVIVPLALATACGGSGTAAKPAAPAAPGGGIPTGPAPGSQSLSEAGSTLPLGYPIVNYEYAVVSTKQPDAAKARDIKAFLHWVITQGNATQFLSLYQFQPLPKSIESLSDAQIAKIG